MQMPSMPKIYGAPAPMVILAVVLGVIYLYLVFNFIQHMRGLGVTWSGKKHKTVLIVGPRNAGKTQLFHAIRDGEIVETVSSMKELSATFRVHPKYNPDKFDAELNVVDFPGHERLRSYVPCLHPLYHPLLISVCMMLRLTVALCFDQQARVGLLPDHRLHRVCA